MARELLGDLGLARDVGVDGLPGGRPIRRRAVTQALRHLLPRLAGAPHEALARGGVELAVARLDAPDPRRLRSESETRSLQAEELSLAARLRAPRRA